jgi:hypothetical protein
MVLHVFICATSGAIEQEVYSGPGSTLPLKQIDIVCFTGSALFVCAALCYALQCYFVCVTSLFVVYSIGFSYYSSVVVRVTVTCRIAS